MDTPKIETRTDAEGRTWHAYEIPANATRREERDAILKARKEIERIEKAVALFRAN